VYGYLLQRAAAPLARGAAVEQEEVDADAEFTSSPELDASQASVGRCRLQLQTH
jgi:hypothetical protein